MINFFKKSKKLPQLHDKTPKKFEIQTPSNVVDFPDVPKDKVDVRYPLLEPYAYAHIKWDNESGELVYSLEEPHLEVYEKKVLNLLEEGIKELLNISYLASSSGETVIQYLEKNVKALISELRIKIGKESYMKIMYYIYRDFVGLGKVEPMMNDYYIEDIECNGTNYPIYVVHRKYRNMRTDVLFEKTPELSNFVEKLAQRTGQYISYANPLLDGALPDGSRVNATYTEDISSRGPTFCFKEGKVQLNDGSVKEVNELFELAKSIYGSKFENGNEIVEPENIGIIGVEEKDLKQKDAKITSIIKLNPPEKLVKLTFADGGNVEVTLNHKFHVVNEKLNILEAKDLKKGMLVPMPKKIIAQGYRQKIDIYALIKDFSYSKKICITNSPEIDNLISTEINSYNGQRYRQALSKKYGVGNSYFYEILSRGNSISFNVLDSLCKSNKKTFEDLGEMSVTVYGGGTKNKTKTVKLPKEIDEDLAYLTGALISDGHLSKEYIDFSCFEDGFKKAVKEKLSSKFGRYESYYDDNRIYLCSLFVPYFFNKIFKIPIGNKSRIVKIPEMIFKSDNKVIASCLKGLFDGDGTVKSGLSYKTFSKKLAEDISYLLGRLGIYSYIRKGEEDYRVNIPAPYYLNFKNTIGFNSTHKKEELDKLISKQYVNKSNSQYNRIPSAPIFSIIKKLGLTKNELLKKCSFNYNRFSNFTFNKSFVRALLNEIKKREDSNLVKEEIKYIEWILNSKQEYTEISDVEIIKNKEPVYDIELEPCTFFIAGNKPMNMFDTIRKFTKVPWTPTQLIKLGTISPEILAYLWMVIEHEQNVMIIGGTGSGKTTMLNGLTFFIPPQARIVSIEDTRELNLEHNNWLPSVARGGVGLSNLVGQKYGEVTLFNLLKESFRQNPDYVIIGEIRGEEAYVLFQGMASGHPSFGTMHADSVDTMIKRLKTPPINLSSSLVETMDVVLVMSNVKMKGKPVRRLREVVEVLSVKEDASFSTNKPFVWDPTTDGYNYVSASNVFQKITKHSGVPAEQLQEEFVRRSKLIHGLYSRKIFGFHDVQQIINDYYRDPQGTTKTYGL